VRKWHLQVYLGLFALSALQACREPDTSSPFDKFENEEMATPLDSPRYDKDESRIDQIPTSNTAKVDEAFARCGRIRVTCVVDGDTIWVRRVKIRVADIDTPELTRPRCPYEKQQAELATERLVELLNEGSFELARVGNRDEDRYGRKLRVLLRDGQSIGDQLTREGLARTWTGRREPWC